MVIDMLKKLKLDAENNSNSNIILLKALAEETRYLIIKVLSSGERCACEIPDLINRTQSNTSMHLAKLLELDILKSRRSGKKIYYSIKDKKILKILEVLE